MNKFLSLILAGAGIFGAIIMTTTNASAACSGIYNHQFTGLHGEKLDLCEYQDKPILVVNTASKCGFTPQFEALEDLYSKNKDKGLLVVGFPSNDFRQDPGNNQQIGDFCKMTYGVKFPMMGKSSVSGADANPFYKELAAKAGSAPQWNFYKYVILPGGKDITVYESSVLPNSKEILAKIKPFLK